MQLQGDVQALQIAGFEVNHAVANVCLVLELVAICTAGIAQLWPDKEQRDTARVLVPCLVVYFSISVAVWILASWLYKDVVAMTKEDPGRPSMKISSTMQSHTDVYTIRVSVKGPLDDGCQRLVSRSQSVGHFVTEDGILAKDAVNHIVNDLLHQLDAPSESSNGNGNKKDM